MSFSNFTLEAALVALGLFLALLACLEIGRRIGVRRAARDGESARAGAGVVEGAVFALLGLLIAFTFSGAASRFDQRRTLIIEEANAIGTAYLRLDLLPAAAQGELRAEFRSYLDARLAAYRAIPDLARLNAELARSVALQQEIWTKAVAASAGTPAAMLLLPAINEMFDIATTRTMAGQVHPPPALFALLLLLALLGGLLAGYAMSSAERRSWVHMATFAFALAGAVYVIIDMEYPRLGLIRVDAFDEVLVDLRQGMR
jgi:hypothetical protein